MMFIKAIEDPKTVIIPISQEANPKYFVMPRILLIRSSLRTTPIVVVRGLIFEHYAW
jgi:hypothetical protein